MKGSSNMVTVRSDKPVDPTSIEVIQEVQKCAQDMGIKTLLIGATARIILLENVYGLNGGRATRDIDFAFAVESWAQFSEFKNCLIATGQFEAHPQIIHKLFFKSVLLGQMLTVDLLPFGGVENDNQVKWPPEMSMVMNVTGYQDALNSAVNLTISDEVIVHVISIPALAVLKLFAWADRNQTVSKDANDFVLLARNYHEAGNQDRLYNPEFAAPLTTANYDPELTGAWILGHDVKAVSSEEAKAQLIDLLNSSKSQQLLEHMAKELRHQDNPLEYAAMLLEQFKQGLMS